MYAKVKRDFTWTFGSGTFPSFDSASSGIKILATVPGFGSSRAAISRNNEATNKSGGIAAVSRSFWTSSSAAKKWWQGAKADALLPTYNT